MVACVIEVYSVLLMMVIVGWCYMNDLESTKNAKGRQEINKQKRQMILRKRRLIIMAEEENKINEKQEDIEK